MPIHHRLAHRLECHRPVLVPSWVLDGASADLDFVNGRYFTPTDMTQAGNFVCSRAAPALANNAAGIWSSFASNVARITDKGLLVEETRTNSLASYNAAPSLAEFSLTNAPNGLATFTIVNDSAELALAGLSTIIPGGQVYKLDNSAGNGDAYVLSSGNIGASGTISVQSVFARGSGNFLTQVHVGSGGGPVLQTALTSQYVRYSGTASATTNNSASMRLLAKSGAVVYFILQQFEAGAFVTSPIVIAGSSAARAADVITLTGAAEAAALAARAARFEAFGIQGAAGRYLDFNPAHNLSPLTGGPGARTGNGVNNADCSLGSGSFAGLVKSAHGFDASSLTVRANGGLLAMSASAWGSPVAPVILGNRGAGDRALNGYMRRATLGPTKGMFDSLTV